MALSRVVPEYDRSVLAPGESRTVVLRVLVDEQGRAVRVVVDSPIENQELQATAINAVLRWSYRPASHNGEPMRGWVTEHVTFDGPPRN